MPLRPALTKWDPAGSQPAARLRGRWAMSERLGPSQRGSWIIPTFPAPTASSARTAGRSFTAQLSSWNGKGFVRFMAEEEAGYSHGDA